MADRIIGLTWQDCRNGRLETRKAESLKFLETITAVPCLKNVTLATITTAIILPFFVAVSIVALYINGFTFVGHKAWYWRNVIDALFWS